MRFAVFGFAGNVATAVALSAAHPAAMRRAVLRLTAGHLLTTIGETFATTAMLHAEVGVGL